MPVTFKQPTLCSIRCKVVNRNAYREAFLAVAAVRSVKMLTTSAESHQGKCAVNVLVDGLFRVHEQRDGFPVFKVAAAMWCRQEKAQILRSGCCRIAQGVTLFCSSLLCCPYGTAVASGSHIALGRVA